ncbi:MAG: hypothetical protein M0P97_00450 [Candidatus Moranbacteria bacterium]|jgi:hypothetical protein|nr:hypothetical protein [Candidatus Moranbacteria bacterium]
MQNAGGAFMDFVVKFFLDVCEVPPIVSYVFFGGSFFIIMLFLLATAGGEKNKEEDEK